MSGVTYEKMVGLHEEATALAQKRAPYLHIVSQPIVGGEFDGRVIYAIGDHASGLRCAIRTDPANLLEETIGYLIHEWFRVAEKRNYVSPLA